MNIKKSLLILLLGILSIWIGRCFLSTYKTVLENRSFPILRKRTYNYKCPEKILKFAQKIKNAVREKNLQKLFSFVKGELDDGPRRRFVKGKSFSEIFSENWRRSVLEEPCEKMGWRGYMLGGGNIWFYVDENTGSGHISRIYGATEERFKVPDVWEIDGEYLTAKCFTFMWVSGDNFEEFAQVFNIPDLADTYEPGKYLTNEIATHGPITPSWADPSLPLRSEKITLVVPLDDCTVLKENSTTRQNFTKGEFGNTYYYLIREVPLGLCQKLAPKLKGKCISSYMLNIYEEYNICCPNNWGIWGVFQLEPEGKKVVVPLRFFRNKNEGLNFIEDYEIKNQISNT